MINPLAGSTVILSDGAAGVEGSSRDEVKLGFFNGRYQPLAASQTNTPWIAKPQAAMVWKSELQLIPGKNPSTTAEYRFRSG